MASTKESKLTPAGSKERAQMLIYLKQEIHPEENLFDEMVRVKIGEPAQKINPTKESKLTPGSSKES